MLKRKIEEKLNRYYKDDNARILVIEGARQIGKTFIIRNTAKSRYKNYIEINLKVDFDGFRMFDKINIRSTEEFYNTVIAYCRKDLGNLHDTIIFLDEIQVYPHLISLLKPLRDENKYKFICSGSLLGVTMNTPSTFIPMGYIEEVKMFPLDFEEFLWANNVSQIIINESYNCFINVKQIPLSYHNLLMKYFRMYLMCGGLPAAVNDFLLGKYIKVEETLEGIFNYYKIDASQYDKEHKLKIMNIYNLLPSYMENKVKRMKVSDIENKKRDFNYYLDEFNYLLDSGIALGVKAVSNPIFPLLISKSKNLIKLYFNDVGILSHILLGNRAVELLNGNLNINLGSIYETFVAQELNSHGFDLYYFDSKKVGEVDFLINYNKILNVLPIEVKSNNANYNYRSIPKLVDKNGNYKLSMGYIFSNDFNITTSNDITKYPIYMVMWLKNK